MSTVFVGSILIIFGYSEAYGQTIVPPTADGSGDDDVSGSNTTRSDIIDCLVNTCINPNFQIPSNTSVIAMAFVNLTLEDLQNYNEVLKSEVSEHINDTIENLAAGTGGSSFSICAPPPYHNELPCPLIRGITISPQNLTLLEQLLNPPFLGNTIENLVMIENASIRVHLDQNQLEARFTSEGPISTNGTEGALGYGILSKNASLVTHTHRGILDSEDQSSLEDPIWHNHFVTLGNVEQCGENLGVVDVTLQSPGEVRIDDNNATISQIPTDGFEGTDSITNEPLSMTLGGVGQGFSVVSFRLNPIFGEDGGLEAVCLTDFSYSHFDLMTCLDRFPCPE
jgi:hypothetical protein